MSLPTFKNDLLGFVRDELARRRGEWQAISSAAKVPYFTMSKICTGTTKNPRINTIQALNNYFLDHPKAA